MAIIMVMPEASGSFAIIYDPETRQHLRFIERKYRPLIRSAIEERLSYEPTIPTRNRKPLRRPILFEATWELRLGPGNRFRVFYDVDQAQRLVYILAVGQKVGGRLLVGGEEYKP